MTIKASNRYMFKIILTYSIFLVVFTTVIATLFTYTFTKDYEKNLISSNLHLLEQVKLYTDKYMLDKLDQLNSLYFSGTSISSTFSEFYTNVYSPSDSLLSLIQRNLQNMVNNNKFILNIYLYNTQTDILMTPDGIYRDASNGTKIRPDFLSYVSSVKTDFWISPLNNMKFWDIKDVLTYVHYIPTSIEKTVFTRSYYLAVININTQDIIQFMQNVTSASGDLMIMSGDKKIIAHSNSKNLYAFTDSDDLSSKITSSESGTLTATVNNRRSVVTWTKSNSNDFRYVSIVPVDVLHKNLTSLLITILLASALITLLGILLIRPITRWTYRPFADLLSNELINTDNSDNQANTEAGNIIHNIFSHPHEIGTIIEKYNNLIINKGVNDLLRGWVIEADELLNHFEIIGKKMGLERYSVVLFELNKNTLNFLPLAQRELTLYRIIDQIDERCNIAEIASVSVVVSSNIVASIINHNSDSNIEEFSRGLLNRIAKDTKTKINIYISDSTSKLEEISILYNKINALTKYSYIYGFGNIFQYDILQEIDKTNDELDMAVLKDLEKFLLADRPEDFHMVCRSIFTNVKNKHYSYSSTQNALLQLVSLICRIARSQNIPIDVNQDMNSTLDSVLKDDSFDQSTDNLLQLADIYFQRIHNKNTYQANAFLDKIIHYINTNIDKEISLSSVAEHFNISAGYLSKFFKENTNTQFSKYVADRKFTVAEQMLVQNRDMAVTEIANQLGYFDTVYFSRLFKERYGCTPAQYRKNAVK